MRRLEPVRLRAWMLPLIVLAIAVPIVVAFRFGGPPGGLAVGAIAVAVILVMAARARFDEPIEVAAAPPDRFAMLVVLETPLEDPKLAGVLEEIASAGARATRSGGGRRPELLLLAPARNSAVAHWLSDLRKARFDAQHRLTLSLATLASADVDARGAVGDSDPVQAVEDTLRTFGAQEVVFVTPPGDGKDIEQVRRRLDRPVRVLEAKEPAAA
ncbi:MAG: hypothetical protein ACJ75I_06935 [Solirubrobacterales bacterium]